MPKTDSTIAAEITGISTLNGAGEAVIEKVELQQVLNSLNSNKLSAFYLPTAVAYVEANGVDTDGQVGNPFRPYLTVDAALDAVAAASYRVIHVGLGTFVSPTRAKILTGTAIIGSGKPVANFSATGGAYPSVTLGTPTKLLGGTIFNNTFWVPYNVNNITLANFGVDCGSDWCTASNGGVAVDALLVPANNGTSNPTLNGGSLRTNINLYNISAICKDSTSSVHGCLVERCLEPVGFNIDTYFGFAGLVSKNVGGQFSKIKAHSHGTFGIVLKQNSYGYSYQTILDGFEITGGNGLCLEDGDGSGGLGQVGVSCVNGTIKNSGNGVFQNGVLLDKIRLKNINVINASGNGFDLAAINNSFIEGCLVDGAAGSGFIVTGGNTWVRGNMARGIAGTNGFSLTGTSASLRMFAFFNDAYGEQITYGSNVYGDHNYATTVSGSINAF